MSIFQRLQEMRKPSDAPALPLRTDSVTSFVPEALSSEYTSSTAYSAPEYAATVASAASRTSFLSRLSSRTGTGRDKDGTEGIRGPVGLRLLHSSPEPLIDLLFVHGLRGGSVKTWRKGNDPGFFWPQHWLPMEDGFHHANIHSFGYESDWASTKTSILNVHDFGQTLLEEMRNSPSLRGHEHRPIIMIGHSMGGLVIKKAFILAQSISDWRDRIRCIFFLATPHRGSDYAALLNNILFASGFLHPRHYITDLTTGSTSTVLINDEFEKCASELTIYSFYETLGMSLGGLASRMIVTQSSAILGAGFKNERVQYINANHRDIVKYDGIDDPGYLAVRNALSGAIHDLLADVTYVKNEESKEQMEALKNFLGISDRSMEYHENVDGTCTWINNREDFLKWRDRIDGFESQSEKEPASTQVSMFWIHANPGTGKTTLSAFVAAQLRDFKLECAHHFFHVGNKSSRSISYFLRSIAYQMATTNAAIREKLIKLRNDGTSFDMEDSQTIWNKVFKLGIFQAHVYSPQYWVVDAMDECPKYAELFNLLSRDGPNFPLRIFLTSRNIPDMQRITKSLERAVSLTCIDIPEQDSLQDIQQYIKSRVDDLSIESVDDKQELAAKILKKSNGIFLWVRLVMDNLASVYSQESILQVLDGIPSALVPYYERCAAIMSENTIEKHITKAILYWTVVSGRPMTIGELTQAINLDINVTLPSTKAAVEGLCGQLVTVDKSSEYVGLIHPTAREFLLSEAAGEFMVSRSKANERLAISCLKFLNGNELRPPRGRKSSTEGIMQLDSPLLHYAATQFTEHLSSSSADGDELLLAVDRFLKTNVLTWVERLARRGVLYHLVNASKNLKGYLDHGAKFKVRMSTQVKNIDDWATDLTRLVTHYGRALIEEPGAIHNLIAPLCPSESAIYRQFGKRVWSLGVVGRKGKAWDDCVASVSFGEDVAGTVSCNRNNIAVGFDSGDVTLYNHRSCQRELVLHHKNPVDLLHLADDFIVCCTTKQIIMQELDGTVRWHQKLRFRCLMITTTTEAVMAVSQHGHLFSWNLVTGDLISDRAFVYQSFETEAEHTAFPHRAPFAAAMSPEKEVIAMAYRGGAICLWDTTTGDHLGWAMSEDNMAAMQILFNPNPNIPYLLVVHTNHDLALFDPWSGSLMLDHKVSHAVGVASTSCSPDGRTFATIDVRGRLQIWDFETLSPLYNVVSTPASFRILKFTSDGFSIVDVNSANMRVWAPTALVRKHIEDDSSGSIDPMKLSVSQGQFEPLRDTRITVLFAHPTQALVFAGKYNGQVVVYSTDTGKQVAHLYTHPSEQFVIKMATCQNNLIATSDVTGDVQVWQVALSGNTIKGKSLRFKVRTSSHMKQMRFSEHGTYLLVATFANDDLYATSTGALIGSLPVDDRLSNNWKWFIWPGPEEELAIINQHVLQRYRCDTFPSVVEDSIVTLQYDPGEGNVEAYIDSCEVDVKSQILIIDVHYTRSYISSSSMVLFDLTQTVIADGKKTLTPLSSTIPKYCRNFIGISNPTKSLVFLHKSSWMCSIDLDALRLNRFTQHFFVPNDYIESSQEVRVPVKTASDDVAFVLHGELVVVKNGLKFEEDRVLEENSTVPSWSSVSTDRTIVRGDRIISPISP